MKKRYKVLLLILIVIIAVCILFFVLLKLHKTNEDDNIISKIDNYNYVLLKKDTEFYGEKFNELKSILNSSEVDYKEYANKISELFVIDLYTMSNKENKYDVEVDFIYPDIIENYKLNVTDTIYKYISNIERPTVNSIEVVSTEESVYDLGDTEYNSFIVKLNWTYEKECDYDNSGTITLIKKDGMLYIVSFEGGTL